MPGEQDYLDLEMSAEETLSFVAQVHEQAPALVQIAREHPGHEAGGVLAVSLVVNVVIVPPEDESLEEIWIGFKLPPIPGICALPPQAEWIIVVLAALLPVHAGLDTLEYGGNFPRPGGTKANEIVVCWRSF